LKGRKVKMSKGLKVKKSDLDYQWFIVFVV